MIWTTYHIEIDKQDLGSEIKNSRKNKKIIKEIQEIINKAESLDRELQEKQDTLE